MTGTRFWGVEWTDGLAGNLLAEGIGVLVGGIFTLVVVDWVLSHRLRRELTPLRRRLIDEIVSSWNLLVFSWALRLNVLDLDAMKKTRNDDYAVLAERVKTEMSGATQKNDLMDRLNRVAGGSMTVATSTTDCVDRISRAADRLTQVLANDVQLQALLADVESYGNHVENMVRAFNEMRGTKYEMDRERDCVISCEVVFRRMDQLFSYVQQLDQRGAEPG